MTAVIAVALALALLWPAAVSAQAPGRPANDSFQVSWHPEPGGVKHRIEGLVRNPSHARVTDVRLQVEGLDEGGRSVGRAFVWAFGDITPGGEASFIAEGMNGAATYRI